MERVDSRRDAGARAASPPYRPVLTPLVRLLKVALQLAQVGHRLHAAEPAPAVGGVEERAHLVRVRVRVNP